MLSFILAAVLCAQIPEPPTDRQVLASLPDADTVRADVSITKNPTKTADGTVWVCIAYFTETRDGVPMRRAHVVYLESGRKDVWNPSAIPRLDPNRR
jgi:hypothetical protein